MPKNKREDEEKDTAKMLSVLSSCCSYPDCGRTVDKSIRQLIMKEVSLIWRLRHGKNPTTSSPYYSRNADL